MSAASHLRIVPRRPRNPVEVRNDIAGLTVGQRNAIWADLNGGSPPKWSLVRDAARLVALTALHGQATSLTLPVTDVGEARVRMAVLYVLLHPKYLIRPPFAAEVNIPGDVPLIS